MSLQTTLTEDSPLVLDATCSFNRQGFGRHASLRMDVREIVGPDIVADNRFMPLKNHVLHKIYCDPPHMIRTDPMILGHDIYFIKKIVEHRHKNLTFSPDSFTRYGFWRRKADWLDYIQATNREFARVLKPEGLLFYKITTSAKDKRYVTMAEFYERMTAWDVLKENVTKSKSNQRTNRNRVHWLTMKPATKPQKESTEK